MQISNSAVLFRTPFSLNYWRASARGLSKLRLLVFAALSIALRIVVSSLFVMVGENLRVYFTFLITGPSCAILGPVYAIFIGSLSDILGFLIHPSGIYFAGYTLSAMLGALFYALFLYRARITVLRVALAKIIINVFVNIGLGSLWSHILFGKAFYFYLAKSLVKNLVLLPVEIILLVLALQIVMPLAARLQFAPPQPSKKIPLW